MPRGWGKPMAEQSTCMSPSCGITVDGIVTICPQCGGRMRTSRTIRIFGWVMLASGLAYFLIMGWMLMTMLGGGPFEGTWREGGLAVGALAGLSLFALLGTANALYMVVTGRTKRIFVKAMLAALAIIVVGMGLIHRVLR